MAKRKKKTDEPAPATWEVGCAYQHTRYAEQVIYVVGELELPGRGGSHLVCEPASSNTLLCCSDLTRERWAEVDGSVFEVASAASRKGV